MVAVDDRSAVAARTVQDDDFDPIYGSERTIVAFQELRSEVIALEGVGKPNRLRERIIERVLPFTIWTQKPGRIRSRCEERSDGTLESVGRLVSQWPCRA